MPPKHSSKTSSHTHQQPKATQTAINATWRPTRRSAQAAYSPKVVQDNEPIMPRLSTPTSTPTKRKRTALDDSDGLHESHGSSKRSKTGGVESAASAHQLPTPESTPTKPSRQAPPATPPSTPSKARTNRQITGRDLLASFANPTKPSDIALDENESDLGAKATSTDPAVSIRPSVKARGTALLERLAEKQKATKKQAPPLTPEEQIRVAALHRVADVARAISAPVGLEKTSTRRSYSAAGLARVVKQSARSVLGDTEVLHVLRLLQKEEAALGCRGFVRIVKVGEGDAVVVDSLRRPQPDALEASARRILESMDAAARQ